MEMKIIKPQVYRSVAPLKACGYCVFAIRSVELSESVICIPHLKATSFQTALTCDLYKSKEEK
jgi:hypothetical protein